MRTVRKTVDAARPALFLEFLGNVTAAPDAASKGAEALISNRLVGRAVQQQKLAGGRFKLGRAAGADNCSCEAHNALKALESFRQARSFPVCHRIGRCQGNNCPGRASGKNDIIGLDAQFRMIGQK